jgi:DNA-binding transcriptional LysR family regulator
MTFDQLETLEAIIEKGSFKAAAESLFKTQPSLSVAIKKLEEEFNLLIFNREGYRPQLTEQGRVFYGWAKQCLDSFRELQTVGKELGVQKIEPYLTIAVDPLARFEAIEGVLEETLSSKAHTEITFLSEILGGGMEKIISGEVDFAVAPKLRDSEDIESVFFDRIEMTPVIAKSLVKSAGRIDAKMLAGHPQVVVLQGDKKDFQKRDSRGLSAEGRKCFVTTHEMKFQLIANGFGWGRLASHEIVSELKKGQLIEIKDELVKPFNLDLHVMRSKRKALGPVGRAVWNQLLKNASTKKGTRS